MLRTLAALILICIFFLPGVGQTDPSTQSCGRRDTVIITTQAVTDFTLDIEDYVNNDLADSEQSLCGIEIRFLHQYIDQFTLSLTSPAGQTIELIGPATDAQFAFTIGARWNISFVPCGESAQPDSSYTAIFDNEQPNNFVAFGDYSGSYYPYQGCLEDFNTGPVNGTWTFAMDNTASDFYPGAMVEARLIFCDSRGVDCCFANAGTLNEPDQIICEGDSSLLLEPAPAFTLAESDSVEYGYTYLLAADSLFIGLDSLPDLRGFPAGQYQVCGLSYRRSEIDTFWMPDGSVHIDTIFQNLTSFTPRLCANLSSRCQNITIVAPPDTTTLDFTACAGDTLLYADEMFTNSGTYYVSLDAYAGCDSIIAIQLDVLAPIVVDLDTTICEGDSVRIGSSVYTSSGMYQDVLSSALHSCDSTIHLDLTVLAPIITDLEQTICVGDSVVINGVSYLQSGNYEQRMLSSQNCDSIIRLDLTVLEPNAIIELYEPIDCRNDGITLDGSLSLPGGLLDYRWFNAAQQNVGNSATLPVNAADLYTLVVTQSLNGQSCQDTALASVIDNRIYPTADAGPSDTLNCSQPSLVLGGPNTSMGPDFLYTWTALSGGSPTPPNASQTQVNTPDVYQLLVTDDRNGCQDSSSVQIYQDTSALQINISGNELLGCTRLQDTLVANISGTDPFNLSWTGPCLSEQADGSIIVDCMGTYTVEVTNLANNCVTTASVNVSENFDPPLALLSTPDTLTCQQPNVSLDAGNSTPTGAVDYSWSGPGLSVPFTGAVLTTALPGDYQLRVIRTDNFCEDTLQFMVYQDIISPIADAGMAGTLSCNQDTMVLAGPNTSVGANFVYSWFNNSGPIAGANEPVLVVDQPNTYTFLVTDTTNGCQDSSVVNIAANFATPEVVVNPNEPFFCPSDPVTLDGSATVLNFTAGISWEGPCITGATNTLTTQADCPGEYVLYVTNLESGCVDSAGVMVEAQPGFTVAALPDTVLQDCITGLATLSTAGSSSGTVEWLYNGNPIVLPFPDPVVSQPGIYSLIISNQGGTCRDTAVAEVFSSCDLLSVIAVPDTITCRQPTVVLSGLASTVGPNIQYQWLSPENNCILQGANTAETTVQCSGEYGLVVSDILFALTDTSFITVYIDTIAPVAEVQVPDTLTCDQTLVNLDGSGSGLLPSYRFFWSEDATGDTLATTVITQVGAPGQYFLTVFDLSNGCADVDQVQVRRDDQIPDISFGDNVIPCMQDTFSLQSFVSPSANYDYSWTGPGIQGSSNESAVLIDTAGTYYLEVNNPLTQCMSEDSVLVTKQACVPCLELASVDTLDCVQNTASISVIFCQECVDCSLQWFDSNGPISGANQLDLTVQQAGMYRLVSVDTLGFSNELLVEVVANRSLPLADAGPDRLLSCDSTQLSLGGPATSTGPTFSYSWTQESGVPLSNNQSPFISVSDIGTYYLQVSNADNQCTTQDTVVVGIDTLPPMADAGPPQLLDCANPQKVLDGSMSSTGPNFSYQWSGPGANCITGATTLTPIVSCAGLYTLNVRNQSNGCVATDTVSVSIEGGLPPLEIFPDTNLTCRDTMLVLVGNLPSQGNYTPRWCEVNMNDDPLPTTCTFDTELFIARTGRFQYLLVNDDTGCENSFIVTVGEDFSMPNVEAGADQTLLCTQDSIQLNASAEAGSEILWTQVDNFNLSDHQSLQPFVYQAATYVLTATDPGNGCTAVDSVRILSDTTAPSAEAGQDTVLDCGLAQLRLAGNGSTNSGSIQYNWFSPDGNIVSGSNQSNPLINSAAWYFLAVTDPQNGCTTLDSVRVFEDINRPEAIVAQSDSLQLNCSIDTLILDGSSSIDPNGNALSYQWSVRTVGQLIGDVQSPTVATSTPGGYRLIVCSAANACCDTLNVNVSADLSLPIVSVNNPLELTCEREQVGLLGESPEEGSYIWTNTSGQIIGQSAQVDVSNVGVYSLVFVADDNGCQRMQTVQVVADTVPPVAIVADPPSLDCANASVVLDGSASSQGARFTYVWTAPLGTDILSGSNSLLAEVDTAGFYQLLVRDTINGCQDSIQVAVLSEGTPIDGLELEVRHLSCIGDLFGSFTVVAVAGGTPPYRYALDGGPLTSNTFFDGLSIGTYTLEVIDALGCNWLETVTIQEIPPISIDLGPDIDLSLGDSLQLQAEIFPDDYASLRWYPSDLFGDSQLPEQTIFPTEGRHVFATVTDLNGCTASDTLRFFVRIPTDVFIPNGFSPNGDGSNEYFSVYMGPTVARLPLLRVYDRWGNMVFEKENIASNDPSMGWDGLFEGRPMNAAVFVYYLEIEYLDGRRETMTGDLLLLR